MITTVASLGYDACVDKVKRVENFTSARAGVLDDTLCFRSMDAGETFWDLDLKQAYEAYRELETFELKTSGPTSKGAFTPTGLLLCLELIA